MSYFKKIFQIVFLSACIFAFMATIYILKNGSYPVEKTRFISILSVLIALNTIFIVPIIQKKIENWEKK